MIEASGCNSEKVLTAAEQSVFNKKFVLSVTTLTDMKCVYGKKGNTTRWRFVRIGNEFRLGNEQNFTHDDLKNSDYKVDDAGVISFSQISSGELVLRLKEFSRTHLNPKGFEISREETFQKLLPIANDVKVVKDIVYI